MNVKIGNKEWEWGIFPQGTELPLYWGFDQSKVRNWFWEPVSRHLCFVIRTSFLKSVMFFFEKLRKSYQNCISYENVRCSQNIFALQARCIAGVEMEWLTLSANHSRILMAVVHLVEILRWWFLMILVRLDGLINFSSILKKNGLYVNKGLSDIFSDLSIWRFKKCCSVVLQNVSQR